MLNDFSRAVPSLKYSDARKWITVIHRDKNKISRYRQDAASDDGVSNNFHPTDKEINKQGNDQL